MRDVLLRSVPPYAALLLCTLLSRSGMEDALRTWYPKLKRPVFSPPRWAFPVAWNILFVLMALSCANIKPQKRERGRLLFLWWIQPVLMWLWTASFFTYRMPRHAIAIIAIMLITAASYVYVGFRGDNKAAALLMTPYALWLGYASYLNISFTLLNDI